MLSECEINCREGIHIPNNAAFIEAQLNARSALGKAIAVPVWELSRNYPTKSLQNNRLNLWCRYKPIRYYVKQLSVLAHTIGKRMR